MSVAVKSPLRLFARGRWSVAIIIQWDTIAHKQCAAAPSLIRHRDQNINEGSGTLMDIDNTQIGWDNHIVAEEGGGDY